ncbi:MAG TPA: ABC transporter substrate-binding protein [Stellaceae bacterium]|nr:ABC transporter substrate-binding protein [Stellaceae bacterium]
MRRRKLLALLAGVAAVRPLAAAAQQKAMPVIGILGGFSPSASAQIELELAAFRKGLGETGYVEGRNVTIEYTRAAEGHLDRLPALAADLVSRKVDVIVTQGGDPASFAAKDATSTIPIVFHSSSDPVAVGLVQSLARPGGNLTGVAMLWVELTPKLLELLLALVPQARVMALLVDPDSRDAQPFVDAGQAAGRAKRVEIISLKVRAKSELDGAFGTLRRMNANGLVLPQSAFRSEIAALALRHGVPAIALQRDFARVGGLASYGPSLTATYHLKGIYAGRLLKGEKPADLPVQQPTKFELVINLKTAKALGLTVGPALLARADEIIE